MMKVTKLTNGYISLNINNNNINLNFNENKIWLTKKEIANVFWINKNEIKEILNVLKINSIEDFNKNTKKIFNTATKKEKIFYSIDIIINLGYRLNSFTATKLLIKINRTLKNLWVNRKSLLNKIKDTFEKLTIEEFFTKRYIMNL